MKRAFDILQTKDRKIGDSVLSVGGEFHNHERQDTKFYFCIEWFVNVALKFSEVNFRYVLGGAFFHISILAVLK